MSGEQACKDPINEDVIPDDTGLPIRVARQMTISAILAAAVLDTCNRADIMRVDIQLNTNRQGLPLIARKIAEAMPHQSFHVGVSNVTEKEMHLPESMIVAHGSHTVAWLATVRNGWARNEVVKAVPLFKANTDKAEQVDRNSQLVRQVFLGNQV